MRFSRLCKTLTCYTNVLLQNITEIWNKMRYNPYCNNNDSQYPTQNGDVCRTGEQSTKQREEEETAV